MTIAFLGLGLMGEPMATNLIRGGVDITVWNRTPEASRRLHRFGANVATTAAEAMGSASTIFLMLRNKGAIDEVLERGSEAFGRNIAGRTLINMGTVAPDFSAELARDVEQAGGQFVECPVSGSRGVAERADLVAMMAGDAVAMHAADPLVRLMAREVYACGEVPGALRTKLAVNLFLIILVTGLAEAANLARSLGLDERLFQSVLNAGPMASTVSRGKLEKLIARDMGADAAISDVLMNCDLILTEARRIQSATPLLDACRALLKEAVQRGEGGQDMIGVIDSIARARRKAAEGKESDAH